MFDISKVEQRAFAVLKSSDNRIVHSNLDSETTARLLERSKDAIQRSWRLLQSHTTSNPREFQQRARSRMLPFA
jgi:hypothetical protein